MTNKDYVSREAVIEWLKDKDIIKTKNQEENARKELAFLSSAMPKPCEDCISRDEAIELIAGTDETNGNEPVFCGKQVIEMLKGLPSVTPQPKIGHWIDTGSGQECSECGEIQYGYDNFRYFCPNCGSKMEV